jgi:hypothetical protein
MVDPSVVAEPFLSTKSARNLQEMIRRGFATVARLDEPPIIMQLFRLDEGTEAYAALPERQYVVRYDTQRPGDADREVTATTPSGGTIRTFDPGPALSRLPLANPDFLTSLDGWTLNLNNLSPPDFAAAASYDSTRGKDETGAARITISTNVVPGGGVLIFLETEETVVITPGTEYEASAWALVDTLDWGAVPGLLWYDAADTLLLADIPIAPAPPLPGVWERRSVRATAPGNAARVRVLLSAQSRLIAATGNVWYDRVAVVDPNAPTFGPADLRVGDRFVLPESTLAPELPRHAGVLTMVEPTRYGIARARWQIDEGSV